MNFLWYLSSTSFLLMKLKNSFQLKLEYLNQYLYSKFWHKSNNDMLCSARKTLQMTQIWIQKIMLQKIRGVHKCYLYRNSWHVLMLLLYSNVITQISVSQTWKLLQMTQLKIQDDHFSLYILSLFLHC